jgi:hypothetical protein
MAAKVSPGQVVTLRYDTGALEKCPISGARGADAPTTAPTNRAPALDPRLLRAIKGAKIGEQRMYLGAGRNRRVWIESIEPALRRAA